MTEPSHEVERFTWEACDLVSNTTGKIAELGEILLHLQVPRRTQLPRRIVKALSLWQPWATLMVTGQKRIETRSWGTNHRGLIAIHATKRFPQEAQELLTKEPFARALQGQSLPKGGVLGVGRLLRCTRMTEESVARMEEHHPTEHAFGLYEPGRYAWVFDRLMMFPEPIPCKGHQMLWDVRGEAAAALLNQLERAGFEATA